MIENNNFQEGHKFVEKSLLGIAYRSHNFDNIPPILGIILADQYGNALMVNEYDSNDKYGYGPIKSYLTKNDKNLLEIDLISGYFSAFKTFAGNVNIQNLSHLEIHGSNIKIQIYFLFGTYIIIVFLNSFTDLNSIQKSYILEYFQKILKEYENDFNNFNAPKSRKILRILETRGKRWLKNLNTNYINNFKEIYLKYHEIIGEFDNEIEPIIQNVLCEYLTNATEDLTYDLTKEIKNQIQDKLFDFLPGLFKNLKKII